MKATINLANTFHLGIAVKSDSALSCMRLQVASGAVVGMWVNLFTPLARRSATANSTKRVSRPRSGERSSILRLLLRLRPRRLQAYSPLADVPNIFSHTVVC